MNRISVVLADDHAVLREGLRGLIDAQPDLMVVGQAANGRDAVAAVVETTPRVLCLDLSMPGTCVSVTMEKVRAASPRTRILILTMHDDIEYARSAVASGTDGYILKTSPMQDLLAAIRGVAAGKRIFDTSIESLLEITPCPNDRNNFSRRELEVVDLLIRGHTHQEIADKLFVSVKTVETYRARIREKTGLKTRADFVRYGIEAGMLTNPEG